MNKNSEDFESLFEALLELGVMCTANMRSRSEKRFCKAHALLKHPVWTSDYIIMRPNYIYIYIYMHLNMQRPPLVFATSQWLTSIPQLLKVKVLEVCCKF